MECSAWLDCSLEFEAMTAGTPPVRTVIMYRIGQLVFSMVLASHAWAQPVLEPAAQRGQSLARTHCARCHSIDRVSPSPLAVAPPFRTLHNKYPVENLEEAMAEGLSTGHPTMPEFRFDIDQVNDFIAFLKTLER
jgi:mono/diheme cytochrome c family protein